ncbi:MAG: DUF4956 domain-containing protein [Lachnospiraceae bacterium]|nr:DUF4956 domain-containing protein [Lachnospiraceae bacterium]
MNAVIERLGRAGDFSWQGALMTLSVALLLGIYVYLVYRFTAKKAFYSRDFNITLAGMTVVTAAIMVAMQSNLVVSLGMVGALSIVRFRTAIKNPLDLLYLFWAISVGIIGGVGLYALSGIACVVLTALVLILQLIPESGTTYVLILRFKKLDDIEKLNKFLTEKCRRVKARSSIVRNEETELIYEILPRNEVNLVKEINRNFEPQQASLVSYDGEYRE